MITGLDLYLQDNGWELVSGKMSELNTYTNCWRVWRKDGRFISVGLFAQPTRIGVEVDGSQGVPLPADNYEQFVNDCLNGF